MACVRNQGCRYLKIIGNPPDHLISTLVGKHVHILVFDQILEHIIRAESKRMLVRRSCKTMPRKALFPST